jgi:hypothetical protein
LDWNSYFVDGNLGHDMEKDEIKIEPIVLISTIVAFLNFLLWLGFSGYGIGLNVDSANYFSVAQSLSLGEGFVQFDHFEYLNAPPLYPILLSVGYFLGLDIFIYALVLQFVFLNLSLFFLYKLGALLFSGWTQVLAFCVSAISYFSFAQVFLFALSEAGFVALLLGYIYFLFRFEPKDLWFAAMLFALLVMQRYAAWFLLPGIVVYGILHKKSMLPLLGHFIPALLLTALWWYRNSLVGESALGEHELGSKLSIAAIWVNLEAVFKGIISGDKLYAGVGLFILCLFLGIANWWLLKDRLLQVSRLILLMAIGFFGLLLLEEGLSMVQLPRYLAVLWMPLMLLPTLFLLQWKAVAKLGGWVLFMGVLVQTVLIGRIQYQCSLRGAGGFHTAQWQAFANLPELEQLQEGDLVSNFPDMVWWLTGKKCLYSPYHGEEKAHYQRRGVLKGKLLIWFADTSRNGIMQSDFGKGDSNFIPISSVAGVEVGLVK